MSSLLRTASWVIKRIETNEVLFETFNPKLVKLLNTQKYEAVPIAEYLANLNKEIKANATTKTT